MISLFRIDDRLIHGQIMTSWSKVTQAKRIIIADDEVIKVQSLNIGGMGMKPGRKTIYKNIAASPLELEALNKIQSLGIDVEFKILPGDKGVRLSSL